MKKIAYGIGSLLILFLLVQCNNKKNEKLAGTWKLEVLTINGTVLQGITLGDWKWKFEKDGSYMTNISGSVDNGHYTLNGENLTLKSNTYGKRPEQHLIITQLDSVQLDLISADKNNKTSLHFLKIKGVK